MNISYKKSLGCGHFHGDLHKIDNVLLLITTTIYVQEQISLADVDCGIIFVIIGSKKVTTTNWRAAGGELLQGFKGHTETIGPVSSAPTRYMYFILTLSNIITIICQYAARFSFNANVWALGGVLVCVEQLDSQSVLIVGYGP